MPALRTLALAVGLAALAACSGPSPRYSRTQIDRALASAPYAAQPGQLVAREKEFARRAGEDGLDSASRRFAVGDASVYGRGILRGSGWLGDPSEGPARWTPRSVWMSCDGRLAISRGRFRGSDGVVGTYVTLWQRDRTDEDYEWVFNAASADDPQPPEVERTEGMIEVIAADIVAGSVADCAKPDAPVAPVPASTLAARGTDAHRVVSPDGTLAWNWTSDQDGTRLLEGQIWFEGAWETVAQYRWPG